MLRRLATVVCAAISGAGLLTAATTTTSVAEPEVPFQTYHFNLGDASWTMLGKVAGQPGNAHSGFINFDTSDDPPYYAIFDWNCPSGVTPPTYYDVRIPGNNDTTCVIKRVTDYGDLGSAPFTPTFTGPLRARLMGDYVFYQLLPTQQPEYLAPIDIRFRRVGPVTRTVVDDSNADFESYTVTRTAPMIMRGRISWVNLNDPRVHASVDTYFREDQFYRPIS